MKWITTQLARFSFLLKGEDFDRHNGLGATTIFEPTLFLHRQSFGFGKYKTWLYLKQINIFTSLGIRVRLWFEKQHVHKHQWKDEESLAAQTREQETNFEANAQTKSGQKVKH